MSRTILVVDDDPNTLSVIVRLLESEGHDVHASSTGAHALERLRSRDYDVLLTDFIMPDISGDALVEEARRRHAAIDCVVMSGHPRPAADWARNVAWIQKPLDIDELLSTIAPCPE